MNKLDKHEAKTPLPVKLLYFLFIAPFFIYVPISILKTDLFLFSLDIALILGILLTVFNDKVNGRVFGGKVVLAVFVCIYIVSVFIRLALDLVTFNMQMITVVRNLLFGMGVFIVSSVWLNTQKRIDYLTKAFLWGGLLTAIWGIRQLLFGFMQYELDRLALMGSSVKEMNVLNRIRITSSFGDPLLMGFFMMIAILFYFLARERNIAGMVTRRWHPFSLLLLFIGLVFSLTRAPLLGLFCGGVFIFFIGFRLTKKYILTIFYVVLTLVISLVGLDILVTSKILEDSTSPILLAINNGAESFWSLSQLVFSSESEQANYFLINQSKDARANAWSDGFSFLLSNPGGAGLTDRSHFGFAIGDTGLLSIGLQIGVVGAVAIIMLIISVALISWRGIKAIPDWKFRRQGYIFLGMWVGIIITSSISSILDSSVISIVIWTIAAILLNQRRIYKNEIMSLS